MEDIALVVRRCKRSNDTRLVLSNRGLFSIPTAVFDLSHLQYLYLNGNKITNIDPKLLQLPNLKVIDLSQNSLMDLPREIAQLQSLEQLILTGNPLSREFELLLKQENQSGLGLQQSLQNCFESVVQVNPSPKLEDRREEQKQSLRSNNSGIVNQSSKYGGILEVEASEFEVGEIISQGGFSLVHHAVLRGTDVALKKIFNPNITSELMNEIENEINMLARLRHPNIVLLMAVTTKPPNLYIATEYMPKGSIYQLLHKTRLTVTEPQKLKIAIQICRVLLYLHLSGIVHRDIKSHNVLLDESYRVKLCDFGLARKIDELNQGSMQFSGTPSYMAPELFQKRVQLIKLQKNKAYDKGVDNFAYGTLLWEIFAREVPFEGIDPQDIMTKVIKGESLQMRNIPKSISQLITDLRHIESSKRPSMQQALDLLSKISL